MTDPEIQETLKSIFNRLDKLSKTRNESKKIREKIMEKFSFILYDEITTQIKTFILWNEKDENVQFKDLECRQIFIDRLENIIADYIENNKNDILELI